MRKPILIPLVLLGLVLGVTACGSDETAADEVPGSPPTLPIPTSSEDDRDPLADASPRDEESSDDPSSDEDDETGSTTDTGTSTDGTAAAPAPTPEQGTTGATGSQPSGQTGGQTGGTPTQGGQDTAENDQPPGNGTGAQKFEEFCEQNDGAC